VQPGQNLGVRLSLGDAAYDVHSYAATREGAMAAFAKSWRRE
jgi:hypothetical protein